MRQDEIEAFEALERAFGLTAPTRRPAVRVAPRTAPPVDVRSGQSRPDDGAPVPEFLLEPRDFEEMPEQEPPWTVERLARVVFDLDSPRLTLAVVVVTSLCTAAVVLAVLTRT